MGHYFRALAVAQPFLVARDNLLLLFEQNRIRCRFSHVMLRGPALLPAFPARSPMCFAQPTGSADTLF